MNEHLRWAIALVLTSAVGISLVVGSESAIPDDAIGLSKVDAMDIATPDPTLENLTEPGEQPPFGPMFVGGPPMIPHGVKDFLPITADRNDCIECHAVEEKVEGEPTPIPDSHYHDLRRAPDVRAEAIAGARYLCVSCHVSLGDNPPLVENGF